MASRFSTGTNANPGAVPIRTTDDAQGNASVGHVMLVESGGLATPINSGNPLSVNDTNIGSPSDASFGGSGTSTVIAALKGIFGKLANVLTVTNPSLEVSNQNILNAVGAIGDVNFTGSGNSTLVAALKGIFGKLNGSLAVTDTAAENSLVTIATNTSATATNTTGTNASIGAPSDAVFSGSGNASAISVLKGIFSRVGLVSGSITDRSGTITAANVSQALMVANAARTGFSLCPNGDVYISLTGTATTTNAAGSFKIPAGSVYESPPNVRPVGAINIISGTTSATYQAMEW